MESESRESCLTVADEYIVTDRRRKNTQNIEEREVLDLMCEHYRMEFKIWVQILKEESEEVRMCHELHEDIAEGLMDMSTEDMKQLIMEFEAQEDVLICHMENVETPLLPEGTIYDNYIELSDQVDSWLTRLQYRIEDLKDEIETGKIRKHCELYDTMYGRKREDFVLIMIWLLNRALVSILTLH
ncbi:uncharacterized protein H6S33_004206 [Morchella sextelata]|uniref:uncharacterized protein n=1 Tax=Morchella sextelata TaxID=1174677 RepID=UPI001D0430FB|nr:uncharacterized protein H6S33_004206 [Morchella sextelata]KAH0605749.1 hypothetical protein H6S33_004206 [Morchella sextelata]